MTERDRQSQFLTTLLSDGSSEARRLKDQIRQSQRNEFCIRRALILMVLVGIFSLVGLGYCAVLLPDFFDNATPVLVKLFCALGLGSLICMMIFGGCWMWYRKGGNAVNDACRAHILEALKRREPALEPQEPISVNKSFSEMYQIGTPDSAADSRIIQFPRAG